ncbi:MAG: hypothetical protein A3K19_28890 [Lentisphaerae bacterium RIFOXYB12_FULL_65_16]|nr:MAG: hypothetical protein A3K18_25475 [Lentisphaerae bacterium RIFOXYA12_64_32]OGV88311.1 MAG: hypothetical protein A3K19_28890 [Lentisphaerae bacterium RIFOXYB12_FULL_65_16]
MSLLLALPGALRAAETGAVKHGPWELQLAPATGAWLSLTWNGETVAANPTGAASADLKLDGNRWLSQDGAFRLARRDWNGDTGTLVQTLVSGTWELEETLRFGALGKPDRLARSLRLTYRPATGTEPAQFYGLNFHTFLPRHGRYLFPATVFDPNSRGACEDLESGARREGMSHGIWPLLLEQTPQRTLLFISDGRRDRNSVSIQAQGDTLRVSTYFTAQGWAWPSVSQDIGTAYMEIRPADAGSTLRDAVWPWFADIGLQTPSDRPDWVHDAALYAFHPGGTTGSGFKDLGGFRAAQAELLPRLARLGFGAVWVLPIEDRSCYWPRDYYRLADGLGTPDEYRDLVRSTHQAGIKVWQDNVPHGGTPANGQLRGNSPLWLAFDEKGDALNYWCWDFRDPNWQAYMGQVSEYFVREYDIDGYRIDACSGSKIVNWRRQGFPTLDRTPANVPEDWWRESLQAVGGVMPPLPYERGSLAVREGGMQMIRSIRQAVKKLKPREGAILAETQFAPYMQETDVIYDFQFCHNALLKMRHCAPAEFVSGMAQWLEEQKLAEPPGTLRMRYVESHDSVRARGWLGVAATRAMTAVSFYIHGMPMIYHDSDVGEGPFLQRLIAVRNALPELRRGDAFYQAVNVNPPSVFAVLRTFDGHAAIGLVNLDAVAADAVLDIPVAQLGLAADTRLTLWNAFTGERLGDGNAADFSQVRLNLPPWDTAILTWRPVGEPCPVPVAPTPAPTPEARPAAVPVLTRTDDALLVTTATYRLTVDAHTGLPRAMTDATGAELLGAADILLDADTPRLGNVALDTEPTADGLAIRARLPLGDTGGVQLAYRCLPDRVSVTAELDANTPGSRVGLVFPAAIPTARYQVNTVEGLLDDEFATCHTQGQPGAGSVYYRNQGTPVAWQAETQPLASNAPCLRAFPPTGTGLEIAVDNVLHSDLTNAMVLDRLGERAGWHAAFFWHWAGPLAAPAPERPARFTLNLRPVTAAEPNPTAPEAVRSGDVTLTHTSLDWAIENPHYRVVLRRTGGVIRELWARQPEPRLVLREQDVYTDKGFTAKDDWERNHAAASMDGETGARAWCEGDTVRLRFAGMLRDEYRFGILRPPVWIVTDYAFDGSPSFRVRWSVMCEGNVKGDTAFLAWCASSPDWKTARFLRSGTEIAQGLFDRKNRTGETAKLEGRPVPDTLVMAGADGTGLLTLGDLQMDAPEPLHNVFTHGDRLYLAWLDESDRNVRTGQWYQASMSITAGGAAPAAAPDIAWHREPESEGIANPSFEAGGESLRTLVSGQSVPFLTPAAAQRQWELPRGATIDRSTAHGGAASMRIANTTGEYTLVRQRLPPSLATRRKLRLNVWVKGENLVQGDKPWKTGIVEFEFRDTADKIAYHHAPAELLGTFDWQRVETVFDVPADAQDIRVRLGINGATGTMWLDDVTVTPAP